MTVDRDIVRRGAFALAFILALTTVIGSCADARKLVAPEVEEPEEEEDTTPFKPVGVYEFTVTGIGTPEMAASATTRSDPAIAAMEPVPTGLIFEATSVSSFTEGSRTQDGHRYITFSYRVRNATGAPLSNLTLIPNTTAETLGETPWLRLRLFDGTDADPELALRIVPTGAVALGEDLTLRSLYPDVLQVFEEAEVAALELPEGITGYFPYGFMVRNRDTPSSRTLPIAADSDDYSGVLTFAFRFPLSAANSTDPFNLTFWAVAVQDDDTRITESIEEAADTAAVRRVRERAVALGVTTTTVLAGSFAPSPTVPDYPAQRQICSVRTAGAAGSAVTHITAPGPFSNLVMLRPGEVMDACGPGFRSGTPDRPATNVAFPLEVRAVDRYGNVKTMIDESVQITQVLGGPPMSGGSATELVDGAATIPVTYSDYGTSTLVATGRRIKGQQGLQVAGVTRTWTAGAETTNWDTGGNWAMGAAPMPLDSVLIPAAPAGGSIFPVLVASVTVRGVVVENQATIGLGPFNLTANANVATGTAGGINGTVGRLVLGGFGGTVRGVVPRLLVTGTYTLDGNLTTQAPLQVDLGRIQSSGFRIQTTSF